MVNYFISHGWHNLKISGIQNNSIWTDKERKKEEREAIDIFSKHKRPKWSEKVVPVIIFDLNTILSWFINLMLV